MFAVKQHRRPHRSSHDLSRIRGLTDEIWALIKNCWTAEPSERPSAGQTVHRLQALPNRPADQRPLDDSFSSVVFRNQIEQPFFNLAASIDGCRWQDTVLTNFVYWAILAQWVCDEWNSAIPCKLEGWEVNISSLAIVQVQSDMWARRKKLWSGYDVYYSMYWLWCWKLGMNYKGS